MTNCNNCDNTTTDSSLDVNGLCDNCTNYFDVCDRCNNIVNMNDLNSDDICSSCTDNQREAIMENRNDRD